MYNCKISGIRYYLPDKVISNDDLAKVFPEWNAEQIEAKVGVARRHIAADGETAVDMAIRAAELLFAEFDRSKVDFVLFCTQSPDYKLPTSACILQDRLRLRHDIGALDFNLGCSGYVVGLSVAKGLVLSGAAKCVLLLTGETYSKYMHPADKANRTVFGDGASASIIERSEVEGIGEFVFGTDGSGAEKLIIREGGARYPLVHPECADAWLHMNGPEIFNFTIRSVPALFNELMQRNHVSAEGLDYVILHQANAFMLEHLRKKMGISDGKFHIDIKETGNTVSSTIPIALADCIDRKIIAKGSRVALVGFGVGLSSSGTIVRID